MVHSPVRGSERDRPNARAVYRREMFTLQNCVKSAYTWAYILVRMNISKRGNDKDIQRACAAAHSRTFDT